MLNNIMWGVTGLSILGTILNIKKKRICFWIWLVTNSAWCVYDFYQCSFAQGALFAVYVCLAIWGIISWRKK